MQHICLEFIVESVNLRKRVGGEKKRPHERARCQMKKFFKAHTEGASRKVRKQPGDGRNMRQKQTKISRTVKGSCIAKEIKNEVLAQSCG